MTPDTWIDVAYFLGFWGMGVLGLIAGLALAEFTCSCRRHAIDPRCPKHGWKP